MAHNLGGVRIRRLALWVKEYAHPLRVIGGLFFAAAFAAGIAWIAGADIEPVAFVLSLISSLFLASPSIAQYLVPNRKPVKDMTFDELLALILTTDARRDWTGVSRSWSSEMFLKEDPRLRFRAKYTGDGVQNDNFVDKWANKHPDPRATGYWYDLYFDGNLIERFILVSVDGGRANLPPPDIKTGLIEPLDYRVAQIHDVLGTLDEYIERSGLQRAA